MPVALTTFAPAHRDAVKYVKESARAPGEQAYWGGYRNRHFGLYNNGVFKYQNKPEARASFARTAAGVATLYSAGVYEDPVIERGLDFMLDGSKDRNGNPFDVAIQELKGKGVDFRACNTTLTLRKIDRSKLQPEVVVIDSGVAEAARLQFREGFAYLRP